MKEGVQLAATDILEVCALNTVGLHKLSTHELLCLMYSSGQKSTFQKMWEQRYDFASATEGVLLPELNTADETSQPSLQFQRWMCFFQTQFEIPGSQR